MTKTINYENLCSILTYHQDGSTVDLSSTNVHEQLAKRDQMPLSLHAIKHQITAEHKLLTLQFTGKNHRYDFTFANKNSFPLNQIAAVIQLRCQPLN